MRVEHCRQFGGPWLALELIRTLQLDEFLKRAMPEGREHVPWSLSALILVIARLNSGRLPRSEGQGYDPRFDVQVHQSLPFMDFSSARWEMLLAVRNTFHESSADASMYDELLVVRPPKRLVGGLTVRF